MIREATAKDSGIIVKILKNGFPENILPYTIYFSRNYKDYISDLILLKESKVNTRFYVCEKDYNIVGFAEIRQFADALFLNNIYMAAHQRGKGLGKELLKKSILMARDNNQRAISLDVFSDNLKAIKWYMSLNLKCRYKQLWILYLLELDALENIDSGWWRFIDLNEGNKLHKIYGFSRFIVQTRLKGYSVGRIADTCFKTSDDSILHDKLALSALYFLDKKRKLLIISEEKRYEKENVIEKGEIIASSLRLSGNVDTLLNRLE